jgi:hypothetical protein
MLVRLAAVCRDHLFRTCRIAFDTDSPASLFTRLNRLCFEGPLDRNSGRKTRRKPRHAESGKWCAVATSRTAHLHQLSRPTQTSSWDREDFRRGLNHRLAHTTLLSAAAHFRCDLSQRAFEDSAALRIWDACLAAAGLARDRVRAVVEVGIVRHDVRSLRLGPVESGLPKSAIALRLVRGPLSRHPGAQLPCQGPKPSQGGRVYS